MLNNIDNFISENRWQIHSFKDNFERGIWTMLVPNEYITYLEKIIQSKDTNSLSFCFLVWNMGYWLPVTTSGSFLEGISLIDEKLDIHYTNSDWIEKVIEVLNIFKEISALNNDLDEIINQKQEVLLNESFLLQLKKTIILENQHTDPTPNCTETTSFTHNEDITKFRYTTSNIKEIKKTKGNSKKGLLIR